MSTDAPDPLPAAAADEAEVLACADEWAAAIVANDPARIAGFMTDDWVMVSASGISPRAHFLDLVSSGQLTHSAMDVVGETRIRIFDGVAVLTARVTNTAQYQGSRFDADEWTTDVFVRRGGNWVCAVSHTTAAE